MASQHNKFSHYRKNSAYKNFKKDYGRDPTFSTVVDILAVLYEFYPSQAQYTQIQ